MLIQLKSNNPGLSYILKKNPNSWMNVLSLRKWNLFNYYSKWKENVFNSYFKEWTNDISFKKNENEEFEYLNVTQFNSPYLLLWIINESFSHLLKKEQENDISWKYLNEIFISNVFIWRSFILDIFKRYFKDFEIIKTQININNYKNYNIIIKTNQSIWDLIKFIFLFWAFLCIFSDEETYLDDAFVIKIFNVSKDLKSSYFINYLLIKTFVKSKKLFNEVILILNDENHNYTFWWNEFQRIDKVINILNLNRNIKDSNILDIWCWEWKYIFPLNKSVNEYHAIDINQEITNELKFKLEKRQIENVNLYNHINEFIKLNKNLDNLDILLIEVIEHIELDEWKKLIDSIKENINFRRLVISTPNKDFNINYLMDDDKLRHDDHKFELTKLEFENYIKKLFNENKFKLEFFNIWDSVNWTHTTSWVIIYWKN